MIRPLAFGFVLALCAATQGAAQQHPPFAHPPGHVPPDSATHAMLHALMHGSWSGIVTAPHADGRTLTQDVKAQDQATFALRVGEAGDHSASDFVLRGDTLQWTQQVKDKTCMATAVLNAAARQTPETIAGTLVCDHDNLPFKLQKKTD